MAREQPGVNFATVVADLRNELGSKGLDFELGPRGPVFRKWHQYCFTARHNAVQLKAVDPEMLTLNSALDELMQGRVLEASDILASKARYLAYGTDTGNWRIAEQFLCYQAQPHSLVSHGTEDEAVRIVRREHRRAQELSRAGR